MDDDRRALVSAQRAGLFAAVGQCRQPDLGEPYQRVGSRKSLSARATSARANSTSAPRSGSSRAESRHCASADQRAATNSSGGPAGDMSPTSRSPRTTDSSSRTVACSAVFTRSSTRRCSSGPATRLIARTCEYDSRPVVIAAASRGWAARARATRTWSVAVRGASPQACASHWPVLARPNPAHPSRASNSATISNQRHVAAASRPASATISAPRASTPSTEPFGEKGLTPQGDSTGSMP